MQLSGRVTYADGGPDLNAVVGDSWDAVVLAEQAVNR